MKLGDRSLAHPKSSKIVPAGHEGMAPQRMKSDVETKVRRDLKRVRSSTVPTPAPYRRTLDKEQVGAEVLLLIIGEVLDNPLDVLRCRHEDIHGLELLGFSVVGDRFNDCVERIRRSRCESRL